MTHALTLSVLPDTLAISRLDALTPMPDWASNFFSVTRTRDEVSIVCPERDVPAGIQSERGWRGLCVAGPLDFALTGVLAALAVPLAQASISIFAISTFDTDYVLVKETNLEGALAVLSQAGHQIRFQNPPKTQ
jgi:uncharacterized protein